MDNSRLREKMSNCGITYDEDQFLCEKDNSLNYVVPDQYTGTTMSYSIDKFDCLKLTVTNDSPEQAGGYEEEYVYVNNEQVSISRLTDKFAYIVKEGNVYTCEVDRDLHVGASVYIVRRKPNRKCDKIYQGYMSYKEFKELDQFGVEKLLEEKVG